MNAIIEQMIIYQRSAPSKLSPTGLWNRFAQQDSGAWKFFLPKSFFS